MQICFRESTLYLLPVLNNPFALEAQNDDTGGDNGGIWAIGFKVRGAVRH